MGRRRKGTSELSPEVLKRKHRYADTKYRSKVQCLYKVLKDELSQPTTKDNLLKLTLDYIKHTEDELSNAVGTKEIVNNVRSEFLSFLLQEEDIWKSIDKNVANWWLQAQNLLHNKCEAMLLHDFQDLNETKNSFHDSDKENAVKDVEQDSENLNSNSLSTNSTIEFIDDSRKDIEQGSGNYSENTMLNSTVGLIIEDSSASSQRELDSKFACSDKNDTSTFNFHDTFKSFKSTTDEDNLLAKANSWDCFYIGDKDYHQINQNDKNVVSVSVQDKHLFASEIEGSKAIPVSEANNLGLSSTTCFVLK